jgi:predicted ribosome quality control (RQC) complex YloA/Tae2 family protein
MRFKFDLRENVNYNAANFFEKSKKLKNKIEGVEQTISKYEKEKIKLISKEKEFVEEQTKEREIKNRKKEWFEKFHWFYTSKGKLCIGGRDASSNENIIKKYTDKEDLVFHTDMSGSPFFVLKGGSSDKNEIEEVANITACYSKAWKKGMSNSDVFYVKAEQVTKEANSGEYLGKGSFMITGKTNYVRNKMEISVAVEDGKVIIGSDLKKGVVLVPGDDKTSDVAKKLKHKLGGLLDDFIRAIPAGGCKIKK